MFCPYCGAKVGDDFSFCAKCGKRLPSLAIDDGGKKTEVATAFSKPANDADDNYLDKQFRRIIAKMPGEALSHFKVIDSAVWHVAMAKSPEAKRFAERDWAGPYEITVCGKKYEAFADRARLPASQVKFLHEWAGGYKRALKMKLRALDNDSGGRARRLMTLFITGIILVGCALAVYLISVKWGGSTCPPITVEMRRINY